jgi:hypothetical protein
MMEISLVIFKTLSSVFQYLTFSEQRVRARLMKGLFKIYYKKPFSRRTLTVKLMVIKDGSPYPSSSNVSVYMKTEIF